jgi:hypothetical protein
MQDRVEEGGMPAAWESEKEEETWSDREAWRGELYEDDCDAWRDEACPDEEWTCEETESPEEDTHAGWPEDLAGPEYWMFKDFEE